MRPRSRTSLAFRRLFLASVSGVLLAAAVLPATAGSAALSEWKPTTPRFDGRQQALLDAALDRLAPQRPGVTDMYVLGVAGDADEDVFRNEVTYLQQLATQRWGAAGRIVSLINHPETGAGTDAVPLATRDSIAHALAGIGKRLDPKEDVLFLYLSSHGLDDNSVYLHTGLRQEDYLAPRELKQLLDDAGIGNAVIVVSACYSGGFIPVLKSANRMIITAARKDRPSFGCGNSDSATWFGRAFLVEAMNATNDFGKAYDMAAATVRQREREQGERPSMPQFQAGNAVLPVLAQWQATLPQTPAVPYPYVYRPRAPGAGQPVKAAAGTSNRKNP